MDIKDSEDLHLHHSKITSISSNAVDASKSVTRTLPSNAGQKLTISQIQELLMKDLANDSISDQDTFQESETSIFEETTECFPPEPRTIRPRRATRKVIENTSSFESQATNSEIGPQKRRPKRAVKKVLRSIENTSYDNSESTNQSEFLIPVIRAYNKPTRQKQVLQCIKNTHTNETLNSNYSNPKKNAKKKAKVKNDENENVNNKADELIKKFLEVEQYKLVVE